MKNHDNPPHTQLLKRLHLLSFTGTKTSRKTISCPVDVPWVKDKSNSSLNEGVAYDYWTCVPKSKFCKSDWEGCCISEIANMMVRISLTNIVGGSELDSNLIEGPELMRQFGLNYRVIAHISEYKKTFSLAEIALITLVDSPDRCMLSRQRFRTLLNEPTLETTMRWGSLSELSHPQRGSYWYLLPKQKGAEVWSKLRKYANSLFDGKATDCPYEIAREFKFDDLSDIPTIVKVQEEFVKQFGIIPGKTLRLNQYHGQFSLDYENVSEHIGIPHNICTKV